LVPHSTDLEKKGNAKSFGERKAQRVVAEAGSSGQIAGTRSGSTPDPLVQIKGRRVAQICDVANQVVLAGLEGRASQK
jgi:hypothetical protein